jgi:nucleotide-binding universal stress UspA family protein
MRILVTYDGSDASAAALPAAARLAKDTGAHVILLRVHHPPLDLAVHPEAEYREKGLRAVEEAWMKELTAVAKKLGPDVRPVIRRLGERWNVVDEILAVAKEFEADLILMATHGESALRHFVVGSTALEVLSRSKCPVVLVRSEPPDAKSPRKRRRK